ncbi:MAG: hypothetical protein KAT00_08500, partial [Planctomycetes bacterium]|nr:hypothetical protein [Planctomycetota bacterium]
DPETTTNSKLQKEFKPAQRHLLHLLRCNHGPTNESGYRIYKYGEHEVVATINAAYIEMLRRKPTRKELDKETTWLQADMATADQLRRKLLKTEEFRKKHGKIAPEDLHPYRIKMWTDILNKIRTEHYQKNKKMPTAKQLYQQALAELQKTR